MPHRCNSKRCPRVIHFSSPPLLPSLSLRCFLFPPLLSLTHFLTPRMIFENMYQVMSLPCFKPCKGFLVCLEKIQCLIMTYEVPLIQLLTFYLTSSPITLSLTVSTPKTLTFPLYLEYANLVPGQAFAQALPPSQGPYPRSLYVCPSHPSDITVHM